MTMVLNSRWRIFLTILINGLLLVANTAIYFLLQIVAAFEWFIFFGEGQQSDVVTKLVSLSSVIIHALLLVYLFYKRRVVSSVFSLSFNLLLITALYCYFMLYLPSIR